MTPRSVIDWFKLIEAGDDDLTLVRHAIVELDSDKLWPGMSGPRHEHLLNLVTAIRLDQMAKEGRA